MSSLEEQLHNARHEVVTDGYEMSIGEIVSLYRDRELVIDPEFQRLFRWDAGRKTSFLESLLLGIPIPPLFVFQRQDGIWELIDGLQRTSTILEFMGELLDPTGKRLPGSAVLATKLLPALDGVTWNATSKPCLTPAQKLDFRRARFRIEILKRESQSTAKFELFQRLNTGGASLSEQEVRNCTMVMIKPEFYAWLKELSTHDSFVKATSMTSTAINKQAGLELVLRFFAFLRVPYQKGLDVHEYLDNAAISLAMDASLDQVTQGQVFRSTFDLVYRALDEKSFRRWDGSKFSGKFLHSIYEVVATGVAQNLDSFRDLDGKKASRMIKKRSRDLCEDEVFQKYSGAGVRGTDRLANLLPMAKEFMAE